MYTVEFYEKANGKSDVWDFLEELRIKSADSKDARIQYRQAVLCIDLLKEKGTRLPDNISKHLEENIWELRPGVNRVLYFYHDNNIFVLLHQFRKKTQKTPKRELDRAKTERDDFIARKETANK